MTEFTTQHYTDSLFCQKPHCLKASLAQKPGSKGVTCSKGWLKKTLLVPGPGSKSLDVSFVGSFITLDSEFSNFPIVNPASFLGIAVGTFDLHAW